MASSTSSKSSGEIGNTSKQISPARHWFFTFNHYNSEDIESMCSICSDSSVISSYVFQEETGKSGTPHLQGQISFVKKCRPKSVFKFTDKIHWELTKNVPAAQNYCQKVATRSGKIYKSDNITLKRPIVKMTYDMLRPWQKAIADLFKEPEDPL